jgi:hypothetical protein
MSNLLILGEYSGQKIGKTKLSKREIEKKYNT